jgi:anionic cell wall polymer biosynthesis LytR-Cps2A-Psr (LCP) family protein
MVDVEAKVRATTVCVAIMDEDNWTSNTDVMVVVDLRRRRLTWVPRDLWSERRGDRINTAFAAGQLLPTLAELGFPCDGALCLRRGATIAALADVEVEVPVRRPLDFWYPLSPMERLRDGRKQISFRPPSERLSGERLHQWIGARYSLDGLGSDLHRLTRQAVLLEVLLRQRADFSRLLANPELVRMEGVDPLPVLVQVTADWQMRVFNRVHDETIGRRMVLRKSTWSHYLLTRARALAVRLLRANVSRK